jgi:hypothetical protein
LRFGNSGSISVHSSSSMENVAMRDRLRSVTRPYQH